MDLEGRKVATALHIFLARKSMPLEAIMTLPEAITRKPFEIKKYEKLHVQNNPINEIDAKSERYGVISPLFWSICHGTPQVFGSIQLICGLMTSK